MNERPAAPAVLEAYLLGRVEFDDLLALQRRLVYEIGGQRSRGVLILCELPYLITVGRSGSSAHIQYEPSELATRGWPVRWINRGGGCLLHGPGQLAVIPVVALDQFGMDLPGFLAALHDVLLVAVREADAAATARPDESGIWVRDRLLAHVGVAIHDWVSYFGAAINIDPDLELFRKIQCDGQAEPMTSLARERRGPVRPALIRQRLVEAFAERFGFSRTSLFHHHPALSPITAQNEFAYRSA
ncbi:MAG: lipoyl(octanoyl) transferase LipB [Gemmataceae bacterium]